MILDKIELKKTSSIFLPLKIGRWNKAKKKMSEIDTLTYCTAIIFYFAYRNILTASFILRSDFRLFLFDFKIDIIQA